MAEQSPRPCILPNVRHFMFLQYCASCKSSRVCTATDSMKKPKCCKYSFATPLSTFPQSVKCTTLIRFLIIQFHTIGFRSESVLFTGSTSSGDAYRLRNVARCVRMQRAESKRQTALKSSQSRNTLHKREEGRFGKLQLRSIMLTKCFSKRFLMVSMKFVVERVTASRTVRLFFVRRRS